MPTISTTVLAAESPEAPEASGPCSVTLYGDSILDGWVMGGGRLAEPPMAGIQRLRPNYGVVDRSVAGERSGQRAATFMNEQRTTRFVVFQHGINDAVTGEDLITPTTTMLEVAKAERRTAIVTGLSRQERPLEHRDSYDAELRRLAADAGVSFADWGAVDLAPGGTPDGLHPSQPYSTRLVERLVEVLDELAPECQ